MNVRLHIDRLVVEGLSVAGGDRARLQRRIESELARLIGAGGISAALARGTAVPTVTAPDMPVHSGASVARLGSEIATSIYGGIGAKEKGR